MDRPIQGFRTDEHGDWVALLGCGHPQHVRHRPPFINRPWVITEQGRQSKLGKVLNCVRCDRFELPEHFIAYQKTPVFTEQSLPSRLQQNHSTKPGVWAKIIVVDGKLRYRVDTLNVDIELSHDQSGIIPPEAPHRVELLGSVRFFLEFYCEPDQATR